MLTNPHIDFRGQSNSQGHQTSRILSDVIKDRTCKDKDKYLNLVLKESVRTIQGEGLISLRTLSAWSPYYGKAGADPETRLVSDGYAKSATLGYDG